MSVSIAETPDFAARADAPARVRFGVRGRELALMFAAWTAVTAFGSTQAYLGSLFGTRPAPTLRELAWNLESVWLWALFTPGMFGLAARFPLEKGVRARHLAVHAAG